MKQIKPFLKIISIFGLVAFWVVVVPKFPGLQQTLIPIIFFPTILFVASRIIGFTDKPGKKVRLFYGGFGIVIIGGILVASLSLNSAFFLFPCLIGIPMIFVSLTIKTLTPVEKAEN